MQLSLVTTVLLLPAVYALVYPVTTLENPLDHEHSVSRMLFHPNNTRYMELASDHHGMALSVYDHRGFSLQQLAVKQSAGDPSYTIITLEDMIPVRYENDKYTYTLGGIEHVWARQDTVWTLAKGADTLAQFAVNGTQGSLTTLPADRALTDYIEATTALKLLK